MDAEIALYDLTGKRAAYLWKGNLDGLSSTPIATSLPVLSAGTYIVRLTAGSMTDEAKIAIQ
jgi:hypothetical protein